MSVEAPLVKLPFRVTVSRRTGPVQLAHLVAFCTSSGIGLILQRGVLQRDRMCSRLESEARPHVASKLHKQRKCRAIPVGQLVQDRAPRLPMTDR